jgi:hypothetical protein
MINEKNISTTRGKLVYNRERQRLELNGHLFQNGDWLELHVFGYWIPGQIAVDTRGWYLLTLGQVGIRLRAGLTVRFCEHTTSS